MIKIVGIGPGQLELLTKQSIDALKNCTHCIGTARQIEVVASFTQNENRILHVYDGRLSALEGIVDRLLVAGEVPTLLASGDPSFYGIGEWVKRTYPMEMLVTLPGISSAQYMFNRIDVPMHDVYMTSVHGRAPNFELWAKMKRVCVLTDKKWTPYALAKAVVQYNGNPTFYIGERLSYANETLTICSAQSVPDKEYEMNVVVIEYEG